MSAPTLYHVDGFGAFVGVTSFARRSPADQDEVWLIPDGATTVAPPPTGEHQVAVLEAGIWSVVADHRGQLAYDTTSRLARMIEEPGPPREGETLDAPPSAQHVWSEGQWTLPLADAKTRRLVEVGAELARRNAAGFTFAGSVYQLDDASQARITSLAVLAQVNGGAGWPEDFGFIAADNSVVRFDAAGFLAFAAAAANAVIGRRLRARNLKDAILAAADASVLAAIDVTTGWG